SYPGSPGLSGCVPLDRPTNPRLITNPCPPPPPPGPPGLPPGASPPVPPLSPSDESDPSELLPPCAFSPAIAAVFSACCALSSSICCWIDDTSAVPLTGTI